MSHRAFSLSYEYALFAVFPLQMHHNEDRLHVEPDAFVIQNRYLAASAAQPQAKGDLQLGITSSEQHKSLGTSNQS